MASQPNITELLVGYGRGDKGSGGEYAKASTGRDRIIETKALQQARTTIEPARSRSRTWILAAAAAVLLAVAGFGVYKLRPRSETGIRVPFERVEVTKLTTNGNSLMAAISPDGNYVAYVINKAGKQSLWLRQVAINSNAQMIQLREGRYLGVAFSPDGDFIYFAYAGSDRNDAGQIYKLPALGIGAVATRVKTLPAPAGILIYASRRTARFSTLQTPAASRTFTRFRRAVAMCGS